MDERVWCASGDTGANGNQNSRTERGGEIKSGQFYFNLCLNYTAETKDRVSDLFELNKATFFYDSMISPSKQGIKIFVGSYSSRSHGPFMYQKWI